MSANTDIQWTDATWNPVRGCSLVSDGCRNCYAMKQAHRFSGPGGTYEGLTEIGPNGPRWNGKVRLVPEVLEAPLHWKRPRKVFVNSMSDLFHESVPDKFIEKVFAVMALADKHQFQILTKRPQRMLDFFTKGDDGHFRWAFIEGRAQSLYVKSHPKENTDDVSLWLAVPGPFLGNVWLGVSVEDQKTTDERIPLLLKTPAAVRFISAEPLLEWINLDVYRTVGWVIVGGESGPGSRPFDLAWARSILVQCGNARVPCFVKQLGACCYSIPERIIGARYDKCDHGEIDMPAGYYRCLRDAKGGDWAEWPEDLRVREFPPCCERDHDRDGNCDQHSHHGVLR